MLPVSDEIAAVSDSAIQVPRRGYIPTTQHIAFEKGFIGLLVGYEVGLKGVFAMERFETSGHERNSFVLNSGCAEEGCNP